MSATMEGVPTPAPERIRRITLPPFDPLNRRAAELRKAGHRVISLGQAIPWFPPPPVALDAARAAVGTPEANTYSTDPGLASLRTVLAERLSADIGTPSASPITADDLVITAGANHAFTLALTTLVDPGDEVVLPSPFFTNHEMAVRTHGATAIEAPVADTVTFAVRWSDVAPHVTPRTRAVVLCNPGNPTGAPITAAEGAIIVRECARRGIVVICDETYMPFVYEGTHWSAASVDGWRATVVVVGGFSKAFGMMGWRVGYLLADAAICDEAIKVQDAMIICAPVISQIAVEAAVRRAWDYPSTFHAELLDRRQALADGLAAIPQVEWTPQPGGFFAFARIRGCTDSLRLSHELLEEAHVVTIPGAVFGESGEGCVRLSYGYATCDQLSEATGRLQRHLARAEEAVVHMRQHLRQIGERAPAERR